MNSMLIQIRQIKVWKNFMVNKLIAITICNYMKKYNLSYKGITFYFKRFFKKIWQCFFKDYSNGMREDQINTSILRSMLELVMEYRNYLKTI